MTNCDEYHVFEVYPCTSFNVCVGEVHLDKGVYCVSIDYGEIIFKSKTLNDCYYFISSEFGFNP